MAAKKKPAGITAAPPKKAAPKKKAAPQPQRKYLNKKESDLLNRKTNQDLRLQKEGADQLKQIEAAYGQPVDFSQFGPMPDAPNWDAAPDAVVGEDFNRWKEEETQKTYDNFISRQQKQWDREKQDFEANAAARGWVPGSPVYNAEKSRLETAHADQRDNALTQAQQVAAQNAAQYFDIGSQARNTYMNEQSNRYNFGKQRRQDLYGNYMQQRNQPVQDYATLMGLQSGMAAGNLQYSQNAQQADRNNAAAMAQQNAMMAHQAGMANASRWGGFGSPEEQAAFEDNRARANQQWTWANAPQQQRSNPWASALGNIGGQLGGAFIGSMF